MKQVFENPELDVIKFGTIDVIATSTPGPSPDVVESEKGGVSTPGMEFDPNA